MTGKKFSKNFLFIFIVIAIGLLIFFNSLGWLGLPREISYRIGGYVFKPFHFVGLKIYGAAGFLYNFKDLLRENSELKQENQELISKISNLFELGQENKLLKEQLQFKTSIQSKMVMADLVGYDPGNLGEYFLINKGSQDGLAENQAVIYAGGYLVGRISEAGSYLSKVMLLVDSQSAVFSQTQDSRVSGVVKGDHGVGLILEVVPQQNEIKDGEMIITSGLDGVIPRGLIIGQVEKKTSVESEAFQRFKIKPFVNYQDLEKVFVILEAN